MNTESSPTLVPRQFPKGNHYLTVLGSGAATPTLGRHCSAQVLNFNGLKLLVDCGEGTQYQIRSCRQKMQSLSTIFISHLHGDHFFGLAGLLSSMHLCGRTEPVQVFAPKGICAALQPYFEQSGTHIDYPLTIHELEHEGALEIYADRRCQVSAFPLRHSVPCYGFVFREVIAGLNLRPGVRDQYHMAQIDIDTVKRGGDLLLPDGTSVPNSLLTLPPRQPKSYAYCCDTAYFPELADHVRNVDLLCIESTFDNSQQALAQLRCHCTAQQAAQVASEAGVRRLMLTHFSARYKDVNVLVAEAQTLFPNVIAAEDGLMIGLQ